MKVFSYLLALCASQVQSVDLDELENAIEGSSPELEREDRADYPEYSQSEYDESSSFRQS